MVVLSTTWSQFKQFTSNLYGSHLFRGQSDSNWNLKTLYHRTPSSKKVTWDRYWQEIKFHAAYVFSNEGAEQFKKFHENMENVDFWNCMCHLQHYGFPTPLLDWTESPYVAAYFAYSGAIGKSVDNVAIYSIWQTAWFLRNIGGMPESQDIDNLKNPFYIFRCDPIGNARCLNQQSHMMVCKDENIEDSIQTLFNGTPMAASTNHFDSNLVKYVLPVSELKIALKELESMNITGKTIWNDSRGICEYLKIRFELLGMP